MYLFTQPLSPSEQRLGHSPNLPCYGAHLPGYGRTGSYEHTAADRPAHGTRRYGAESVGGGPPQRVDVRSEG